jgi:EmrB/QacA subfamily drug resistance transporter
MTPARREPTPYLLLATVASGALLAPLNSTMIAVALPAIRDDFGVGHGALGWLVSSYLITMAVAQPVAGRVGDQLGRSRVFRLSLLAFLVLSLLAAAAPSFLLLVLFRTGQAAAGAALIPNGMGMLRAATPTERFGRVNGLYGSFLGLSAASGPLIGAALLAAGPWRLLFLLNVPVIVIALLLASRGPREAPRPSARPRIDIPGIALLGGVLLVVTALLNGSGGTFAEPTFLAGVAALAALAGALLWTQRRTPTPVAEWRLFRSASFSAATAYILLTNLAMYTILLAVPFFITEFQGHSATTTGLLLGAEAAAIAAMAPVGGVMADALGRRAPALIGAVAALAGAIAILAGLGESTGFGYLAVALTLFGLGIGLGTGPATTAAVESAPRSAAGGAAGTNSMMRYAGSILGAGLLAGILDTDAAAPGLDTFRAVMLLVVAMLGVAVLTSTRIHRFPPEAGARGAPPVTAPASVNSPRAR